MTRPSRSDIHASHSNYLQSIVSNMALGHRRKEGSSSSSSSAVSKEGQGNTGTSTGAGADIDTADTYYVDGKKGNDANPGTAASPVASVGAGVALCRKKAAAIKDGSSDGGTLCTVVVLPASYYLDETLLLTAETHDSGLQLNGLPDPATHELPVLSGGTLLSDLQWTPAPRAAGFPIGVVQAAVPTAVAAAGFAQLFVDGNRVVRARHPNANPGGYVTTINALSLSSPPPLVLFLALSLVPFLAPLSIRRCIYMCTPYIVYTYYIIIILFRHRVLTGLISSACLA